eukprot:741779-Lingulodinium_polyedra.AAC.1
MATIQNHSMTNRCNPPMANQWPINGQCMATPAHDRSMANQSPIHGHSPAAQPRSFAGQHSMADKRHSPAISRWPCDGQSMADPWTLIRGHTVAKQCPFNG